MAVAVAMLHLDLELESSGQTQSQNYCYEWLRRPIGREYGIGQTTVGEEVMLSVNLDAGRTEFYGDRVFFPIEELLGYIVGRHFPDSSVQHRLHIDIRRRVEPQS